MTMQLRSDRRTFLASSALGVLFLRTSNLVFGAQANEKLNIAIIGAGGQGGGNTLAVAGENIVALCDVDAQRAGGTFDRFPNAKKYVDFRKMFDEMRGAIDAVVVSTPDHTHAAAAVAAMKAGLHVHCEKPLTRTVVEARLMRETAAKQNVVTQMGNQGSASEGLRRATELAWAGVVGELREAHIWFGGGNNPVDRPKDEPPVPATLQWDLWLGPAPVRPYNPAYVPASWRNWRAFGTGSMGDFGCHSINLAFRGLRLDRVWNPEPAGAQAAAPTIRVEAEASETHPESYSRWMIVRYQMPARGSLPAVPVTWYNGGPRPPQDLLRGHPMTEHGCLLVGEKGAIFSDCPWNTRFKLLPEKQFEGFQGPAPTIPRGPGHHAEWIQACKGGAKPFSSFDFGGSLTEMILLGHAALLAGHPLVYNPQSGTLVNGGEDNRLLHRDYRAGWTL
jgi:predicted dehydrogenase